MLRNKVMPVMVSLGVLTASGMAFSSNPPGTTAPMKEQSYDVTTDVLLAQSCDTTVNPAVCAPVSQFLRDHETIHIPATIQSYPPNPCDGMAQVWNTIIAASDTHHHNPNRQGRLEGDDFRSLGYVLQTMANNTCAAAVTYRIDPNHPNSTPTIVSIQPIAQIAN